MFSVDSLFSMCSPGSFGQILCVFRLDVDRRVLGSVCFVILRVGFRSFSGASADVALHLMVRFLGSGGCERAPSSANADVRATVSLKPAGWRAGLVCVH